MAGRMSARLMAVVAEGKRGRFYIESTAEMEEAARKAAAVSVEARSRVLPRRSRATSGLFPLHGYGMPTYADLFTDRQLVALTTFSDLVSKAHERVKSRLHEGACMLRKTLIRPQPRHPRIPATFFHSPTVVQARKPTPTPWRHT